MAQSSPKKEVMIEPVQENHFAAIAASQRSFLNSKLACCCVPLGVFDESEEKYCKLFKEHPANMEVAAVATVDGSVVGFVQLILHGMYCEIHEAKEDEGYVYF